LENSDPPKRTVRAEAGLTSLRCPHCGQELEEEVFREFKILRCPRCRRFWAVPYDTEEIRRRGVV